MARTLLNSGVAADARAVLAVDTDGDTLAVWTTPGASTVAGSYVTSTQTADGLNAININGETLVCSANATTSWSPGSLTNQPAFTIAKGCLYLDTVIDPFDTNSPVTVYAACADFDGTYYNGTINYLVYNGGATFGVGIGPYSEAPANVYQRFTAVSSTAQVVPKATNIGLGWSSQPSTSFDIIYGTTTLASVDSGTPSSANWNTGIKSFNGVFNGTYANPTVVEGTFLLIAVFSGIKTAAQLQSLHEDPYGALFESSGTSVAPLGAYHYYMMNS